MSSLVCRVRGVDYALSPFWRSSVFCKAKIYLGVKGSYVVPLLSKPLPLTLSMAPSTRLSEMWRALVSVR